MRRVLLKILFLISLPLAVVLSSFLGRYFIPPLSVLKCIVWAIAPNAIHSPPQAYRVIVVYYRLPRIIAACLTGIALSTTGAALQSILRNPLVDSYILGVSAGAAFGAALKIAFLPQAIPVELTATIFAIAAFALVMIIAWGWGRGSIVSIVLSGIIINAFFSAALSIVEWLTPNPEKLASITFWLMGDIGGAADWGVIARMMIINSPLILILFLMRWRMNILSLGDEEAKALGVNPSLERAFVAGVCALITATTVCYTGIIGWVGLIVPHIVRLALGSDNKLVIPYSILLGGTYMILSDDASRCLTTQVIPISVLTTLMGVPMLIYLLRRGGRVWR